MLSKTKLKYYYNHYILTIFFGLFLFFLLLFLNNNLIITKKSIALWSSCILPSLLPFFIATELLQYTNINYFFRKFFHKLMKPLFNVPGEGAYAFIMGIISGYPIGAKIVSSLYECNICTKQEANRMIAFTNNSSPLFIIGTVGILLYKSSFIGILLFVTHFLSSILVGIILNLYSSKNKSITNKSILNSKINTYTNKKVNTENFKDIGNILSKSIKNAISSIFIIGGFVVIFSIILSILNELHFFDIISYISSNFGISDSYCKSFISGLIELTNGVQLISQINTKTISINIILTAFLLGFGGISILLQVYSIISKYNLSIKSYILGKILQGELAAIFTALLLKLPFFNLDFISNQINILEYLLIPILIFCILITLFLIKKEFAYGI